MKNRKLNEVEHALVESGDDIRTINSSANSIEDDVRQLAEYFYHGRLERNEPGTPEEDWYKAEELLATID